MSSSTDPVAAVCDRQVRLYGGLDERTQRRPLMDVIDFPHRGAALHFAAEYDARHKPVAPQGSSS